MVRLCQLKIQASRKVCISNWNSERGSWSHCRVLPPFCRLEEIPLKVKGRFLSIWVGTDSFLRAWPLQIFVYFCLFEIVFICISGCTQTLDPLASLSLLSDNITGWLPSRSHFFWDRGSCIPDWLWTCDMVKDDLELVILLFSSPEC